jgi:serine phosphatase RsbU (regulator of sigma subunit)
MFGFDGLHALLARSGARSAAALMEECLAACRGVLQGRDAEDDVTLVVLQCHAPAASPGAAREPAQAGRG